jgi:hypothetical protein
MPEAAAPMPPGKEKPRMRSRLTMTVVAVLVLVSLGLVVTFSMAAGPKQYQWTGTVMELDPKTKTMIVDKGGPRRRGGGL